MKSYSSRLSAGTRVVTINRPQARNALTREVLALARRAFDEASSDPAVRCVVLCGAGRPLLLRRRPAAELRGRPADDGSPGGLHGRLPRPGEERRPLREADDRDDGRRRGRLRGGSRVRLRPARRFDARVRAGEVREDWPHARRRRHVLASATRRHGARDADDPARRQGRGRGAPSPRRRGEARRRRRRLREATLAIAQADRGRPSARLRRGEAVDLRELGLVRGRAATRARPSSSSSCEVPTRSKASPPGCRSASRTSRDSSVRRGSARPYRRGS